MRRLAVLVGIIGAGVFFSIGSNEPVVFGMAVVLGFLYYRGLK